MRRRVYVDGIAWDEHNREHACRRATATQIEQVLTTAATWRRHRRHAERVLLTDRTDGGRRLTVIARYDEARPLGRPITTWEEGTP